MFISGCGVLSHNNVDDAIGDGATIKIYNVAKLADAFGVKNQAIIIDEIEMSKIEYGQVLTLQLDSGKHEIWLETNNKTSHIQFTISANETVYFVIEEDTLKKESQETWVALVSKGQAKKSTLETTIAIITLPVWLPIALVAYLIAGA